MKRKKDRNSLFGRLVEVCAHLRSEEGCLWDREQSHRSLLSYLREESEEVAEAVESGNPEDLMEELGDLLYQVIFHSQIASENGEFDIYDVVRGITEKLIRRHPHVFSDIEAGSVQEIKDNWDRIKKKEKENRKK